MHWARLGKGSAAAPAAAAGWAARGLRTHPEDAHEEGDACNEDHGRGGLVDGAQEDGHARELLGEFEHTHDAAEADDAQHGEEFHIELAPHL